MQIKAAVRYHSIPTRMVTSQKTRCGEIGTLIHCWVEHKMVQLLWKTIWWFLKKLELPNGPAFPLSINPREMKVYIQQDVFKKCI